MGLISRFYTHYYRQIFAKLELRLREIRLILLLNLNAISNKKKRRLFFENKKCVKSLSFFTCDNCFLLIFTRSITYIPILI